MSGSLPQFDLVFSYSSVEHSGLGSIVIGLYFTQGGTEKTKYIQAEDLFWSIPQLS